jgi:hypothetical protein
MGEAATMNPKSSCKATTTKLQLMQLMSCPLKQKQAMKQAGPSYLALEKLI